MRFKNKEAFDDIMSKLDGGGMWGFADMPEEYQRQYYLDNNMIDELKWMDEDE